MMSAESYASEVQQLQIARAEARKALIECGFTLDVLSVEPPEGGKFDLPSFSDVGLVSKIFGRYVKGSERPSAFAARLLYGAELYELPHDRGLGTFVARWGRRYVPEWGEDYLSRIISRTEEKAVTSDGPELRLAYDITVDMGYLALPPLPAGVEARCRVYRIECPALDRDMKSHVDSCVRGVRELPGPRVVLANF